MNQSVSKKAEKQSSFKWKDSFKWKKINNFPDRVTLLYIYGLLWGGIIPMIVVSLLGYFGLYNSIPDALKHHLWPAFILVVISMIICFFVGKHCEAHPKRSTIALYLAAICSLFGLSFFVFASGGPINSLFSFSFFYIPLVVAIVFKGPRAPIIMALLSIYCYKYLLWDIPYNINNTVKVDNPLYTLGHFIMTVYQLSLTIYIEMKVEVIETEE
jgi:hypothetical protein